MKIRLLRGGPNSDRFYGALVALIAFLVYANSLGNGFVWDDRVVIVYNASLRGDAHELFTGLDAGRPDKVTPYYRPLTLLTFLAEERLFGMTPFPMHLLNVLLHAVNAVLVYSLARSLDNDSKASLFAALLFAVHPVNTEAVDFISARNTLLSVFFVLIAYLIHRRAILRDNIPVAFAGAGLFFAALLSKETGLMILPFIVMQEFSPLPNTFSMGSRAVGRTVPYVFFAAIYFVLRDGALSAAGVKMDLLPGLGARLLDNVFIIPRYFLTILWPSTLSPKYSVPEDMHLFALELAFAWLCIIIVLVWLLTRGRSRVTIFGLAWFAVFLLPVSGVVPLPSAPLADRYLYAPAIGLWLIAADQTVRNFSAAARMHRYGAAVAASALLVLAAMTGARNLDWKNNITLFSRYVERNPEKALGHYNLGAAYLEIAGDLDAAEREFQKTLVLDPGSSTLYNPLGSIRLRKGDFEGAAYYYSVALAALPVDRDARLNRAIAYEKLGKYREALADYKVYLTIPDENNPGSREYAEERVRELSR